MWAGAKVNKNMVSWLAHMSYIIDLRKTCSAELSRSAGSQLVSGGCGDNCESGKALSTKSQGQGAKSEEQSATLASLPLPLCSSPLALCSLLFAF